MPHPDAAAEEGASGEDYRFSAVDAAEVGADAADALLLAFTAGFQAGHHRFAQGEVGGVLQQLQHLAGIEALVGLGAQGPHRRAAAGVEDAFLDGGGISQAADHPTEGIHFMDKLALGGSADGRVAGLPGDAIEIEAEQGGVQAQPGGGDGRFTTGMAAADHDHVEGFGGGSGEAHWFIIRRQVRMKWSGEKLRLNSKQSVQIDIAQGDLGVVVDVSQDEISIKFSCCKGEFVFTNESIAPLGLEVQDLILPA